MTKFNLTKTEMAGMVAAMDASDFGPEIEIEIEDESFCLDAPDDYESDEDSLGELSTNDEMDEYEGEDAAAVDFYYEDDGQPSEYDEWQDYYGGDEYQHGTYGDY